MLDEDLVDVLLTESGCSSLEGIGLSPSPVGAMLLEPQNIKITEKVNVEIQELARLKRRHGPWIPPGVDFTVAVSEAECSGTVMVRGGIIDQLKRGVGV